MAGSFPVERLINAGCVLLGLALLAAVVGLGVWGLYGA